jgi:pyrroloquinoline quinone biosynthesis protein B
VEIDGPGPKYQRENDVEACRLFYVFRQSISGKSVVIAPAVARLEPKLREELAQADAILLDGTFWSSSDFAMSGVAHPSVVELARSHLPIAAGTLETLAAVPAKRKLYIHINNTNPVLWDHRPEPRQLGEFRDSTGRGWNGI